MGDENTNYFHRSLKQNHRRIYIHGFSLNGSWTTNPASMKTATKDFFENKFKEPASSRPKFSNNLFSALNADQSSSLEAPFTPEEINNAVWTCDGDKAQGPDGLSLFL